jgi:hypothetical protein
MNYEWIIPKFFNMRKARLGAKADGGYIYPIDIRTDALLSYGIGSDVSFESDFYKHFHVPVICLDPTVDSLPPGDNAGLSFIHEGVGPSKSDQYDTLANHINRFGLKDKKITLKMDVEGAEWDAFDSLESFDNIHVLVMELHDLCNQPRSLLIRISSYFECFHVHGNNYCGMSGPLPNTVEVTFIARHLINEPVSLDNAPYPGELDCPNSPGAPDIECRWWK